MRVDPKHLEKCELWQGSVLQIAHKNSALSIDFIKRKFDKMVGLPDLTPNEYELRDALFKTLNDHAQKT